MAKIDAASRVSWFYSECAHSRIGQPDSGLIGAVVRLLEDDSPKVRARALGTVHNLSTDARSIGIIREEVGESGRGRSGLK